MSLPLPVSSFEQYMLSDDRRQYPMCFAFHMEMHGQLRRNEFFAAIEQAALRHPLLCAKLVEESGRLFWMAVDFPDSVIEWQQVDEYPAEFRPMQFIDLTLEIGLRVWVKVKDDSARIMLQVHHACCDGLGAMQFVEDVMIAYHNKVVDAAAQLTLRPLESAVLAERGKICQTQSLLEKPKKLAIGIARGIHFFRHQPIQLRGKLRDNNQENAAAVGPRFHARLFEKNILPKIQQHCEDRQTINDHLLAHTFAALFEWHNAHSRPHDPKFIRVGIPVNLRSERHKRIPAANVVTVSFLDRESVEVRDPAKSVMSIHKQMMGIKQRKSGTFVRFMQFMGRKQLRGLVSSNRVYFSAMHSNVGEVWQDSRLPRDSQRRICFGDLVLNEVAVQAPVRKTMPVFFGAYSYAGRLHSIFSYDCAAFDADEAAEFHKAFTQRIGNSTTLLEAKDRYTISESA